MVGIIAEYNPFHNGHLYHLNKVKEMFPNKTICLILAGNFLNRGEVSIIDKWDKTKLALEYGIDLIVELPFVFATQASDIYAYGAISILDSLNCEFLVFGSECNDINLLNKIVSIQDNETFKLEVNRYTKLGYNYPTSLSKAIYDISSLSINTPNDLLGISYIKQIKKLNSKIKPITIKRTNNYHDLNLDNEITSASSIRNALKENKDISSYIPEKTLKYIKNISLDNYFDILKHQIIIDDLTKYQDVDKNLEKSFKKNIMNSNNLEEFILKVKSKNYTYNKIKRCLVHILCGLVKKDYKIEYIRILGFNQKGKDYLNKIKKDCKYPILVSFDKLLDMELQVTKVYSLISKIDIKSELQKPIIKF